MYQLIYTSAPRLLEAGKTGFGTLARSKDMPQPLVSYMERLSTFDRAAGIRALQFYSFFSQGSLMYHVFSRVADAGADYTGRTNHLAQHFAIECGTAEDMAAQLGTPAGILLALGPLWLRECDYQPRILDEADMPGNAPTSPTGAWQQLTGTPGCEKWLARHAYRNGACLRFREPADTQTFLKLMHDAQLCMPTKGWGRGFSSATVSNLSAQLFPVTALDTRQQAAGITCPPGCPALDIMPGMQPPPAQDDQPAPPPTPEQRSKPIPQVSAPPHAAPIPMETIGGEVETVLPVHPAAPGHPLPPGHAPSRTAPARQALKGKTGTTRERKSGLPVPLLIVGGLAAGALCAVLFQGKSDKPAKPTRPVTAETSSTKDARQEQEQGQAPPIQPHSNEQEVTEAETNLTPEEQNGGSGTCDDVGSREEPTNNALPLPPSPQEITIDIPKDCLNPEVEIPQEDRKFKFEDDHVTGSFTYKLSKTILNQKAHNWTSTDYRHIFIDGEEWRVQEIPIKFKVNFKDDQLKKCIESEKSIQKALRNPPTIDKEDVASPDNLETKKNTQSAEKNRQKKYNRYQKYKQSIDSSIAAIKNRKSAPLIQEHEDKIKQIFESVKQENGKTIALEKNIDNLQKLDERLKKIAVTDTSMTVEMRKKAIKEDMSFNAYQKNKFKIKIRATPGNNGILKLETTVQQP